MHCCCGELSCEDQVSVQETCGCAADAKNQAAERLFAEELQLQSNLEQRHKTRIRKEHGLEREAQGCRMPFA